MSILSRAPWDQRGMLRSQIIIKDVQLKEGKLSKKETCKREGEREREGELQSVFRNKQTNKMLKTGPDLQGCGPWAGVGFGAQSAKEKLFY